MLDIRTIRAALPAVSHHVYLNTGTYGPLPDAVRAAMEAHVERAHHEGRIGEQAYAGQSGLEAEARSALARVVHAPVEAVALTHCTSDGLNVVVGGIDWEAVQGLVPILFTLLFLSTINLPLDLIPIDWFRWVATVNPVSFLVDAVRSLIITGWDPQVLLAGFAVAVAIAVLGVALAALALRGRLQRT